MIELKESYLEYIRNLINSLANFDDYETLQKLIDDLYLAYTNNTNVYIAGSGACAALAEHASCDWSKGLISSRYEFDENKRTLKVQSLTSNVANLTAYSNDISFEKGLALYYTSISESNDLVIIFTTSGNSEFLYQLAKICERKNIKCWIVYANKFDNKTDFVNVNKLYFNLDKQIHATQIAEDIFSVLCHVISIELKKRIN